jgi:hypothetical protein
MGNLCWTLLEAKEEIQESVDTAGRAEFAGTAEAVVAVVVAGHPVTCGTASPA